MQGSAAATMVSYLVFTVESGFEPIQPMECFVTAGPAGKVLWICLDTCGISISFLQATRVVTAAIATIILNV
jgi:hypothetical protein